MSNFLILNPIGLLYKIMHIIIIFNPKAMKFGRLVSVILCGHICNVGYIYENIHIFLSNDNIWNYWNLNSPISQTQLDIGCKFSGFSRLISCYQVIED